MTMTALHRITAALHEVADAVTQDDRAAYVEAVAKLREAGGTDEQIEDAYTWRNSLRRQQGRAPVTFTVAGQAR